MSHGAGLYPRSNFVVRVAAMFITICLTMPATVILASGDTDYRPGEIIVQVADKADLDAVIADFSSTGLHDVRLLSRRMGIYLLEYDVGTMKAADHEQLLDNVRNHPRVLEAQFNHNVTRRATTPDDPGFGLQWGLNNTGQSGGTPDADIDAPEAWDLATGGTTELGEQIVVAIIDGGFDLTHEDIDYFKNTLEIPNNGIDDDGNGYIDDYDGWDVYGNDGSIPVDYHGTHVAGIAGAVGNNGTGVSGVNWGVKIMPVAGSSTVEATVIAAYGYVLEMRARYNETDGAAGAFVVSTNASFGVDYGNPANFPLWCGIYDSLGQQGILSAAATANIGMDIDVNGDVPTACASDFLVSVTNTTHNDLRNSGAAWGLTTIDLGAPGTSIYSTVPTSSYDYLTGTSMATPHVAGAIGFLYAVACPAMLQAYKDDPAAIALAMKDYLLDGTDPNASLAGQTVSGGRLNLFNSAQLVQTYPCGLTIQHTPLPNTRDTLNDYEVICRIYSDTSLDMGTLFLHYTIASIEYAEPLLTTGTIDEYHAFIPAQSPSTVIDYYLTAADDSGDADTTDVSSFRVIDYDVLIVPQISMDTVPKLDTAWHDFALTNNGVFNDEFTLAVSEETWTTTVFDASGATEISTTGVLAPEAVFDFRVRVLVPESMYGDTDSALVTATSLGDPGISASASVITISAGGPLSIPFFDSFAEATVDIGLWLITTGVEVNDIGLNEPTAPFSANFNGNPGGADTLMSHVIDLDGYAGLVLSYAYEQTGGGESPDPDDDLFVEYYNDLGQWQLVNQHLGADPDMTSFETVSFTLPADAYHSLFRIRIRNTATIGPYDDWFVDDVRIDYPAHISVTPEAISDVLNKPDSNYAEIAVTNIGQGTLGFNVALRRKLAPSRYTSAPARGTYPEGWRGMDLSKGEWDPRKGTDQTRASGGPDGFGYTWVDSDDPDGPAYTFEDITLTGTVVTSLSDDNSVGPFTLDFDFPCYGNLYNEIYISSNGMIGIGTDANLGDYTNDPIPTSDTPNRMLAWMWDDLNPTESGHSNAVHIHGNTERCIIQFSDYAEFGGAGAVTAQVVLFPNGTIEYRYASFTGGMVLDEATVGIENDDGTDGLEVVFNAAYLHDTLLVRFSSPALWLTVDPLNGLLTEGQSATLTAWYKSADLDTGYYYYEVEIRSNDPDPGDNPFVVPVTLQVTDCLCPYQSDYDADGFLTPLDLSGMIDVLFQGTTDPHDPGCPTTRSDFDCDQETTPLDLAGLIDHLYQSGPGPCDPCGE
jgi:hypothetical protein